MYYTEIARDHGLPPERCSFSHMKRCMSTMNTHTIGPLIQFRRWWSAFDATKELLVLWHTMLVCLITQYAFEGTNAFDLAKQVLYGR